MSAIYDADRGVDMQLPLRDGARVEIVAGDLAGEWATVVDWDFRDLRYRHSELDERRYWVVVDGGFGRVPVLREQVRSCDEVFG